MTPDTPVRGVNDTPVLGALDSVEDWFVSRGLPHFVERHESVWEIWGRAVPLLIVGYLLLGLNALDVRHWSWQRNVTVAVVVVIVLAVTLAAANLVRGQPAIRLPEKIGPAELAVLTITPALPSFVLGQPGDGVQSFLQAVLLLAVIWAMTSYGVLALVRWAGQNTLGQLAVFANVVFRALPLLLLFMTFLFINAEVWQMAGRLVGPAYALVLGIFFAFGALFIVIRVPALMRDLNTFDTWRDVHALVDSDAARTLYDDVVTDPDAPPAPDRPTLRQRLNIGLVALFSQAIQITAVALAMTAFFIVFGVLAIPLETIAAWTTLEPASVHTFATFHLGGRELVLTEPLIRVAAFLGAFTGMYFTVVLSTDATYRDEFADDVGPELRRALAVRVLYRRALHGLRGPNADAACVARTPMRHDGTNDE